jgi:intracellular sulfur oxidation DsrE/DsrF family protein
MGVSIFGQRFWNHFFCGTLFFCGYIFAISLQAKIHPLPHQKPTTQLPIKGSVLTKYGPVFPLKNRDVFLKNQTHKIVFSLHQTPKASHQRNKYLESVARFINMHVMNGVPLKNLNLVVVMYGSATKDGLHKKAYQTRFFDENPNSEMIQMLHEKGVQFYQCGQSLGFMGIKKSELAKPIQVALSAMTMLSYFQSKGYALVPL